MSSIQREHFNGHIPKPPLTIYYDAVSGHTVPDAKADDHAVEVVNLYKAGALTDYTIGSATLVYAFRLAVARGEITHNDIQFSFNSQIIPITNCATIKTYPKGFCDYESDALHELVKFQISEKRKSRQDADGQAR